MPSNDDQYHHHIFVCLSTPLHSPLDSHPSGTASSSILTDTKQYCLDWPISSEQNIIPRRRVKRSDIYNMKHSIDGRSIADEKTRTETSENEERGGRPDGTKRICGSSSLINQDGQTKLHLLCQNNTCSKEEVDDLIIAFPAALSKRDVYGRSVSSMNREGKLCHFSHECTSYLSLMSLCSHCSMH